MNTKPLIAALFAVIGTASALAQDITPADPIIHSSTLTRTEVRDAFIQARAAGQIQRGDSTSFAQSTGFVNTRAQVNAETIEALRVGAVSRHEKNSFPTEAQLESIRMAGQNALPMTTAAR